MGQNLGTRGDIGPCFLVPCRKLRTSLYEWGVKTQASESAKRQALGRYLFGV